MSDTHYNEYGGDSDSEFIVNDNNNDIMGGEIFGGACMIQKLLIAVVVVLVVMILVSFVMPRKHKQKQAAKAEKAVHNHPGCANHGKVFNNLLVPSNFYDPKQQGFKYINWNVNS